MSECRTVRKNQENLSEKKKKRSDTLKSIESKIKTGYFMTKQVIKLPVFLIFDFVIKLMTLRKIIFSLYINTLRKMSSLLSKVVRFFMTNL